MPAVAAVAAIATPLVLAELAAVEMEALEAIPIHQRE
jgi:hypothetical protein